ncbi:MAG: YtxH domain-containing protein [Anaerolineae bacterium]|jgi:gas vesicle protein
MGTKNDISSFFSGFFVGALIGGATALLLAPQSGEETRTQLRERGIELRDKAEATYTDVLQRVEATTEELRQRTEEISAKVDEAIAQGKQEIAKMRKQVDQEAAEEASDEG